MSNILHLQCITSLDLPPDRVLDDGQSNSKGEIK